VLLVFEGAHLHVDFGSWMDLEYAGVSETRIIGFLERCDVPVWIVPRGDPFTTKSFYYSNVPLVSDKFRQSFLANYTLIEQGEFYRVWSCRGAR
jgi:hypothetical protein